MRSSGLLSGLKAIWTSVPSIMNLNGSLVVSLGERAPEDAIPELVEFGLVGGHDPVMVEDDNGLASTR